MFKEAVVFRINERLHNMRGNFGELHGHAALVADLREQLAVAAVDA